MPSVERQYQDEIDRLEQANKELLDLLRHSVYRNHEPSSSCSACKEIEDLLR